MRGKFLVIEGIDGCGKSTQVKMLTEWLGKNNIPFFLTKEPSEKGFRKIIKELVSDKTKIDDPALDALLFTADRKLHIDTEIKPALEEGKIVISDRYYHSTFAYQQTQGLELEWLREINRFALKPFLTIIFDVPAEISVERLSKDSTRKSFDKFEKSEFLSKLRENYLKLVQELKEEKIIIIDTNKAPELIFEELKGIMTRELGLKIQA